MHQGKVIFLIPHIISFLLIWRNVAKGIYCLPICFLYWSTGSFIVEASFLPIFDLQNAFCKEKKNHDEVLKNQKHYLQTSGIIYSIKFVFKAIGKNAFDLFPLNISKEHKIISNKLSRIPLVVIKFPYHFMFLVTLILWSTTNVQLNYTESIICKCESDVVLFTWFEAAGMLLTVCFFPTTYYATQQG